MRERCEEEGMKIDLLFTVVKQAGVAGSPCSRRRYLLMSGSRSRTVSATGRQPRPSGPQFQSWGEWHLGNNNPPPTMLITLITGTLKACKRGENSLVDYKAS